MAGAAELRFSRHYDDNMVLQCEKPVLIRGLADKGVEVTVSFSNQTKKTKAGRVTDYRRRLTNHLDSSGCRPRWELL